MLHQPKNGVKKLHLIAGACATGPAALGADDNQAQSVLRGCDSRGVRAGPSGLASTGTCFSWNILYTFILCPVKLLR